MDMLSLCEKEDQAFRNPDDEFRNYQSEGTHITDNKVGYRP